MNRKQYQSLIKQTLELKSSVLLELLLAHTEPCNRLFMQHKKQWIEIALRRKPGCLSHEEERVVSDEDMHFIKDDFSAEDFSTLLTKGPITDGLTFDELDGYYALAKASRRVLSFVYLAATLDGCQKENPALMYLNSERRQTIKAEIYHLVDEAQYNKILVMFDQYDLYEQNQMLKRAASFFDIHGCDSKKERDLLDACDLEVVNLLCDL